jgi:hypothetical protein
LLITMRKSISISPEQKRLGSPVWKRQAFVLV